MDTIDILNQQSQKLLNLEISKSLLNSSLISKQRDQMIRSILYCKNSENPQVNLQIDADVRSVFAANGIDFIESKNIYLLSDKELEYNVQGCLQTIENEYNQLNYYQTHYTYATQTLFEAKQSFTQEQVLLRENEGELKVADLLSVSKYAVKVAQAIDPENENYDKANAAITVFQGIDAVLKNKPDDKPINKMLHLANDFLTTVVKASAEKKETKGGILAVSLMVVLTIDFLCKK